ncbi:GTPase Era [Patescibacteria group bacterium]|nr:GTPase Era [Patescibacteria group bacterium]
MKYGRVVIIGRPNTGKSTLINGLLKQKVAITSHLPQTTRKNIRVVYSDEAGKLILSDTPGVLGKVEDLLGKKVNLETPKEMGRADVVIMVVDISRPKNEEENKVIGLVRKSPAKKILVYNKVDLAVGPKNHLPDYNYLEDEFDRTVAVSALKTTHLKSLVAAIFELLPEGDPNNLAPEVAALEDTSKPVISMPSSEFIAEIIREKAYLFLRDEIPYSINVRVESVEDKGKIIVVKAIIETSAERYKKIIIGKNGQKIKEIGYNARKELQVMSGRKVYLELNVVTNTHWQELLTSTEL